MNFLLVKRMQRMIFFIGQENESFIGQEENAENEDSLMMVTILEVVEIAHCPSNAIAKQLWALQLRDN